MEGTKDTTRLYPSNDTEGGGKRPTGRLSFPSDGAPTSRVPAAGADTAGVPGDPGSGAGAAGTARAERCRGQARCSRVAMQRCCVLRALCGTRCAAVQRCSHAALRHHTVQHGSIAASRCSAVQRRSVAACSHAALPRAAVRWHGASAHPHTMSLFTRHTAASRIPPCCCRHPSPPPAGPLPGNEGKSAFSGEPLCC